MNDVLAEIERLARTPQPNGRYPVFKTIRSAGDIEEARAIMRRYVQHAWANRGEITQQEMARHLGLSVNTFKKIIQSA